MYQISSESPEFDGRYYRKHFGLFFFWTHCTFRDSVLTGSQVFFDYLFTTANPSVRLSVRPSGSVGYLISDEFLVILVLEPQFTYWGTRKSPTRQC